MPRDYLLDTNVVSALTSEKHRRYAHAHLKLSELPQGSKVSLPIIAIGEIECGLVQTPNPDEAQQAKVRAFVAGHNHFDVDEHTVRPYAAVRKHLWLIHGTRKSGGRSWKEKKPGELHLRDRQAAEWIGIDERDLLIVSIALQYNLEFVTLDRNPEMCRIEAAVDRAVQCGDWHEPLHLLDWTPLPVAPPVPPA